MTIERVNHEQESQRQLLSQYFTRDTPKLRAVLKSFTDEIQSLHEDVIYLERMLFLDEAEGVFLDIAGELVVEPRNGREDDVYREAIRVKAAVNRFSGTVDDLLTLIRLSYDGPSGAKYTHTGGPTADIVIDAPIANLRPSIESFQRNLNQSKPAGREVYVHFNSGASSAGFRLDTEGQGLDAGKLFGTISDGKIVTTPLLTYIHNFGEQRSMLMDRSTLRDWLTIDNAGPTTIGVVYVRLLEGFGEHMLWGTTATASLRMISLANGQTGGVVTYDQFEFATPGDNWGFVETPSGSQPNIVGVFHVQTLTVRNDSNVVTFLDKSHNAMSEYDWQMPLFSTVDQDEFSLSDWMEFPTSNWSAGNWDPGTLAPGSWDPSTRWGMVTCWAAAGVEWDQTKQDAYCDALRAGERLFPVEATSGWDYQGLTEVPAVVKDSLSGNGPDLRPSFFNDDGPLAISTCGSKWTFGPV